MRKVKRVIMPNQEVTKKVLYNSTKSIITDMPNFNLFLRYYKYTYDKYQEKYNLTTEVVSIRKEGNNYTVVTSTREGKYFRDKNKIIDYVYNEIIKKEWLKIPQEIRGDIREKLLGWR